MKRLDAFWRSLDDVLGFAASAYDWHQALGDEWVLVERFLKARGDIVLSVGCPSPGGDECPRRVVRTGANAFRAVCANTPRECAPLDLTLADVAILALDPRRLAIEIAVALEIDLDYQERRGVIRLGRHLIAAGTGFPVALVIGSTVWRPVLHLHDFDDTPGAILVSSASSLNPDVQNQLRLRGHRIHVLADVVGVEDGRVVPSAAPAVLFRDLRDRVAANSDVPPRPPWSVPAGTAWEKLKLELTALEEIRVSTGGQTRTLRPEHLGLRNEKTGKCKEAWILLTTCLAMEGTLTFTHPTNASEKQVQLLGRALRSGLGPNARAFLKLSRGEYQATFVAVCSLPRALAEISGDPLATMRKKYRQPPGRKARPKDEE